jgi:hypothetical protein
MAAPAVVILTEPANCEHVDPQVLLQAVLQTQQLSREGVPVSQAFCDNPAAAAEFMDAYAKAYSELEPRSRDLPPPEQLYTMIADGRLAPLLGLNTAPDGIKLEAAAMLQPLLVLSLGKPDALMQALQSQQSVRNSVKVIEIAPDTEEHSAPVSVAAAVAGHTIGATTWNAVTTSSQSRQDDAFSVSEEGTNASLKLETVESNLDHVESSADVVQVYHRIPAVGIVGTTPVSPADDTGAAPAAHAGGLTTGGGGDTSLVPQSDQHGPSTASVPGPTAAPAPESIVAPAPEPTAAPETRASVPDDTSPNAVQGGANAAADVPKDSSRNAADPHAPGTGDSGPDDTPPDAVQGANASAEAPDGSNRNATDPNAPGTGDSASDDTSLNGVQSSHEPAENAADADRGPADPNLTDPHLEDLADGRPSFNDPDEDVVYPPTGTLTSEDDMSYPLPAAATPEADVFGHVLRMSMADDIVDLEAMSLSGAVDASATEPFDPTLTRPAEPDDHGGHDIYSPVPQDADLGHFDLLSLDQDTHQDKTITPVNDLDI